MIVSDSWLIIIKLDEKWVILFCFLLHTQIIEVLVLFPVNWWTSKLDTGVFVTFRVTEQTYLSETKSSQSMRRAQA